MRNFTLDTFVQHLEDVVASYPVREKLFLKEVGHLVENEAKKKIGHLQPGWQPLAAATIADKEKKGYDFNSDHNPLYRDGTLLHSIKSGVMGKTVVVGSSEDTAVWQEMGTHGKHPIPARSFLGSAMFESKNKIQLGMREWFENTIQNKKVSTNELRTHVETYQP